MTTTEQDKRSGLAEALAKVQANLPTIEKSKTATVTMKAGGTYSYKYADLADAVEKTYPLLAQHGLSFSASPTLNASDRFVLAYALLHESGEERSGEYPLPDPSSARPQDIGSAITYARRYSFCAVTGLVTEEDDDGNLAQQAHSGRLGGKPKAQASARQSQPQPTRTVNSETGEIHEPPNVSAAIEKLDQEGRKELLAKMEKANFPAVDQLPPAAAKQIVKWVDDLLEEQKKREPF
jgi:hypothetical protein